MINQQRIALYGGTFDPIHNGHISLALAVIEQSHVDGVWFCPAKENPQKMGLVLTPSQHRLKMIEMALEGIPNCFSCDIDLYRPSPSYMIDTVTQLKKEAQAQNISRTFYLLMGDDLVDDLPKWKQVENLLQLTSPLIGNRFKKQPSWWHDPSLKSLHDLCKDGYIPTPLLEISATDIRKRLHDGLYCGHLMPQKALDYALQHELYGKTAS